MQLDKPRPLNEAELSVITPSWRPTIRRSSNSACKSRTQLSLEDATVAVQRWPSR